MKRRAVAVTCAVAVACQLAFLAAVVLYVAYAPLSVPLAVIEGARAVWPLPCAFAAVGLVWAFAFTSSSKKADEGGLHPLRWLLRRLSFPLLVWHLLFLLGAAGLLAWGTAESLCDPLVRTVWLRTNQRRIPILPHGGGEEDELEPLSVVTRPSRFPTFAFVGEANDTGTRHHLHLRLSFLLPQPYETIRCAVHDTEAVLMGRRAVLAAVLVLLLSVLTGMALLLRPPDAPPPPPVPAAKPLAFVALRPPTKAAVVVETHAQRVQKAAADAGRICARTLLASVVLSGLAIMGLLNDVDAWDWRAFYLLLFAAGLAGYLVAGLSLVALAPDREEEDEDHNEVAHALAAIWLSAPLIAARAVHALLAPNFFYDGRA